MRFVHLADCHIGGWRDSKLKELSIQSFEKAVQIAIERNVGFVLISGDLFDNALPSIDILKRTANSLNKLKEFDIPVYVIAGSHDFSASGKTMLDVLEHAGLIENVCKYDEENVLKLTEDRTGSLITGLLGKRNSLEIGDYKDLKIENVESSSFRIFMFHTAIDEFKPSELDSVECTPVALLPKGFDYYAGGHVHYVFNKEYGGSQVVFPGPLFPNNFRELEKMQYGGFYVVEVSNNKNVSLEYFPIKLKELVSLNFNADGKDINVLQLEIESSLMGLKDKIVTLRVEGKLSSGKPSQLNMKKINNLLLDSYAFLKNTSKLVSEDFDVGSVEFKEEDDVELAIVEAHKEEINSVQFLDLLYALDTEKVEGERNPDYEKRILKDSLKILNLVEDDNKKSSA